MSGPACLFVDTDVLFQLFIGGAPHVLRDLRSSYDIAATIVPEVEIEVTNNRKFGTKFASDLRRSLSNGWIQLMDGGNYGTIIGSNAHLQTAATGVSYADIQRSGQRYNYRVDRGEAYTHATAVALSQPAASNDFNAIRTLDRAGMALPNPVLRTFDLITFAYQIGTMSERDCNQFRKELLANNEFIPRVWRNANFLDGLRHFVPRLVDTKAAAVGQAPAHSTAAYARQLNVIPV